MKLQEQHADLQVFGVTYFTDENAIADFRERTGARYPILAGLTDGSRKAYGVESWPSLRVVGKDGALAGDSLEALRALLGS